VCRIRVHIADASDGKPLDATLTEITAFASAAPRAGTQHAVTGGQGVLETPGTVRLRAEVPGYEPLTLSPVLDSPALMEMLTRLEDKDLLAWETFERIRALLANIELTFNMKRSVR
jgi:hypothetical protein